MIGEAMTNGDVTFHFAHGIDPGPKQGTDTLRIVSTTGRYGPTTALLSYGVPIAARVAESGVVFVDGFSDWSKTTNGHANAAGREAKKSGARVWLVDFGTLTGDGPDCILPKLTDRAPKRERQKPLNLSDVVA